jgi:hypothetical protein
VVTKQASIGRMSSGLRCCTCCGFSLSPSLTERIAEGGVPVRSRVFRTGAVGNQDRNNRSSEAPTRYAAEVDRQCLPLHILSMEWEVEVTDEWGDWFAQLKEDEQESVAAVVGLLEQLGPGLPFPHSSGIEGSRHGHMRELRVQHRGRPIRMLYAFDPRRVAILLIGGDKTGQDRWYVQYVPLADRLYDEHLEELRREGLL